MRRRSLLDLAAGLAAGGVMRPASGQIAPQATLVCDPTYRGTANRDWFPETLITNLEREAQLQGRALRDRPVRFQALKPGLNVILTFGQSNAFGTQAHPSLPLPNIGGIWMLGASHRGKNVATSHEPHGNIYRSALELNPLMSTTLVADRSRVLTYRGAAELSAAPPCDRDPKFPPIDDTCNNRNAGEAIGVLFTAYLRQRIIALKGADQGDLVLVDCSEPGRRLKELNDSYFLRIPSAFQKIRAAAPEGTSVCHVATLFVQGSDDYDPITPPDEYIRELHRCFDGIDAAARQKFVRSGLGMSDQDAPAVGIIMQTSGRGVTSTARYDLSISLAQQRFARERHYSISQQVGAEHGLHFTNNGARIAALSAARGAEDVLLRRENHIDVAPIQVRSGSSLGPTRGPAVSNELLIPFTAANPMCFVPIIQRDPATTTPFQLQMIKDREGPEGKETFGVIAHYGTAKTPVLLNKLFWVSDRVLCVRAEQPWPVDFTVGCGYRTQAVGRTNISTVDQRGSGYNYIYLPPNAGFDPPLPYPPVDVMEPYENVPSLNDRPLPNTEFSLLFEVKFSPPIR